MFGFVFLQVLDEDCFDVVASVAVYSPAFIVDFGDELFAYCYADLVLVHLELVLLSFYGGCDYLLLVATRWQQPFSAFRA